MGVSGDSIGHCGLKFTFIYRLGCCSLVQCYANIWHLQASCRSCCSSTGSLPHGWQSFPLRSCLPRWLSPQLSGCNFARSPQVKSETHSEIQGAQLRPRIRQYKRWTRCESSVGHCQRRERGMRTVGRLQNPRAASHGSTEDQVEYPARIVAEN